MPKSALHKIKRGKNLTVLAILLVMVAGLFYLTILKMHGA